MRLLFFFLLLVNVLVYLWYNLNPQKPDTASTRANTLTPRPRIVLLSELPANTIIKKHKTSNVKQKPDPDPDTHSKPSTSPQKNCYTLGPFTNNRDLTIAIKKIAQSRRDFTKRVSEERKHLGYRVYLPPLETRDAALQKAEELKLLGEKHFFVIKSPAKYTNAISLGVFSNKANAQRRHRQLKNLGFNVELEDHYRQTQVYWIDYSEQAESPTLNIQDFAGARNLSRPCEVIASDDRLP